MCDRARPYDLAREVALRLYWKKWLRQDERSLQQIEARVFTIPQNQNGTVNTQESSALNEPWPNIAITVAPQIPSDRLLSLQALGNAVIVNAPDIVRPHLVYFYTVSCLHGSGTNDGWDPLKTTILQEPYCDDLIRHWVYAVSAPGYAVAAISMGF
jgi:hypothetical protein